MNRVRVLVVLLLCSLFALFVPGASAKAGNVTQLAMVVDGSGSIASADFAVMKEGLADAVETCLPANGTVELTVVQFSSSAAVVLPPTVITDGNRAAAATTIWAMVQMGGGTAMDAGISTTMAQLTGSPHFASAKKQVMNISTDGVPNSASAAVTARDNAVTAGLDELDVEGVGSGPNWTWLRDSLVYPQPGTIYDGGWLSWPKDNRPQPGWVRYVDNFDAYASSVCAKIEAIIEPGCCTGKNCPDDPELSKDCATNTPPFYVVINRSFEDLSRTGSGCQPIILKHAECEECCRGQDPACAEAERDLETRVCPLLAARVDWSESSGSETVYEMCCGGAAECDGNQWFYRQRLLYPDGSCPIDEQNDACYDCLPPNTGVDLPAPVLAGGLAVSGLGLLVVGLVVRRRTG